MNKAGLELSINAIVVLILAILTIGLGIFLFSQLFGEGQEITEIVTQETREQINQLLLTGTEDIIAPISVTELQKDDSFQFPFGVRHNPKYCQNGQFIVQTEFNMALDELGRARQTDQTMFSNWYLTNPREFELTPNQKEIFSIPVKVADNAQEGWTYVFNVKTLCDGKDYTPNSLQKLYVVVQ